MNRLCLLSLVFLSIIFSLQAQDIPLAEHPRPDFERTQWQNINGQWDFAFDPENEGLKAGWYNGKKKFDRKIMVPFPWGSALSGVEDGADYGWYQRSITIDPEWKDQRIFLTIGASDWQTIVWLDGQKVGWHEGGYVPIEVELTKFVKPGQKHRLTIRVDDKRRDFTLYGKQGYGNARGIWQTVYLEARPKQYLENIHFSPDIDQEKVTVEAYLPKPAYESTKLSLNIKTDNAPISASATFAEGQQKVTFDIPIPNPHLWDLDDPFLYKVTAQLGADEVKTYFGMRKISIADLPGTDFPYITLNDKPIYLQLALDQAYHPEGFYTFPSDQFMREEIERSKSIGLNGIRIHIKVEIPRKLYWADKLGLLVMADLPNSWGEPDEQMQAESEYTLRQMIKRDYNHPSIFSWIAFNETWGLFSNVEVDGKTSRKYLPRTQQWVASMYYLTRSLDPTRIVEDNSICCGRGHTETDINSWHAYLPGWEWHDHLSMITSNNHPGSTFHFEKGFRQGDNQPNINSECGNVWGYDGSAGDIDWSWDYHRMINTFRIFPEVAGWLYTEHHDVINEWNGYWRFDRSEKETGMGAIVDGMSLKDLHAPFYISTGNDIAFNAAGGSTFKVPLYASFMTGTTAVKGPLRLEFNLTGVNEVGEEKQWWQDSRALDYEPWLQKRLRDIEVPLPNESGVGYLSIILKDASGNVLHRNFVVLEIAGSLPDGFTKLEVAPQNLSNSTWSTKQWTVLNGMKMNGAGKGYFEYEIPIPSQFDPASASSAYFLAEVSAKTLFVKDMDQEMKGNVNYMLGDQVAPSQNPNAYPMTDEVMSPSELIISVDGKTLHTQTLPDDPADHRGVLSWHHQLKDRKLREAGSYGYLVKVAIPKELIEKAANEGFLKVRLSTNTEGGLAIYGKQFGRYPFNPSLVIKQ